MSVATTYFRRLRPLDAHFAYRLAADEEARAASFDERKPGWRRHIAWMFRRLQPDTPAWVMVEGRYRVGIVYLDREKTRARIGVNVAPSARGRGIGQQLIQYAADYTAEQWGVPIEAEIKTLNARSLRAFEAVGFTETSRDGKRVVMRYTPRSKGKAGDEGRTAR